ncbi:MAG: TetR/AcrR family transcriptional regulator [Verrucomicrobiales bacterium]|nr:TetR/AcrR family transcriptional regulator [Verrucomicrobiales bacterium]
MQIAEAALNVVDRHGLRGLNVARVAKAVGVVPSGLYRHFSSKDAVLDTVLDLIAERIEANVTQARQSSGNALDRLHGMLTRHVELVRCNSAIPRVVLSEELLHGRPPHRLRMYNIIRDYLCHVESLIRVGQREGVIRSGVDPEAASSLFLGLIQPSVVLWAMSAGEFDIASHAEAAWGLFVEAVRRTGPEATTCLETSQKPKGQ